ncbi:hypothetical protein [Frankia sp. CiP3]|uniref:hypothetical protein n=1 Tax=Frankia sp. CiP3 TaxID=2880971 RepID=UPI001EF62377|nr:hypothetical protein [Frankia sp. CiP3]
MKDDFNRSWRRGYRIRIAIVALGAIFMIPAVGLAIVHAAWGWQLLLGAALLAAIRVVELADDAASRADVLRAEAHAVTLAGRDAVLASIDWDASHNPDRRGRLRVLLSTMPNDAQRRRATEHAPH